jgi:hypothetical protein
MIQVEFNVALLKNEEYEDKDVHEIPESEIAIKPRTFFISDIESFSVNETIEGYCSFVVGDEVIPIVESYNEAVTKLSDAVLYRK